MYILVLAFTCLLVGPLYSRSVVLVGVIISLIIPIVKKWKITDKFLGALSCKRIASSQKGQLLNYIHISGI